MATAHIRRHDEQTESGKTLGKRVVRDNAQELQKESGVTLKKWRIYGRQLDWTPFLESATVPEQKSAVVSVPVLPQSTKPDPCAVVNTPQSAAREAGPPQDDVMITEEPVPAAVSKTYDLMDDLLEAD